MDRMQPYAPDTIAAIATPAGEGGVAVIRVSGPRARSALKGCFSPANGKPLSPRRLTFGRVISADGEPIDEAMGVFLPAPRTYTREDVCEIQCHGGRGAPARALSRLLEMDGVRAAEPGEFTKRAFLNGRVDLSEAEAVMDVIRANGEAASRAAARQLEGGVSRFVRGIRNRLKELLALVSASVDFPEEIDEEVTAKRVLSAAEEILSELRKNADPKAAKAVREGVSVVLAGKPNVGKSSLLNAFSGHDRAIVSEIPGTTRDVLTERISYKGILLEISDTAGQRDAPDALEALGVTRARRAVEAADCVFVVLDGSRPASPEDEELLRNADGRYLLLVNKGDLPNVLKASELSEKFGLPALDVSAETGMGVELALDAALRAAQASSSQENALTAQRHILCARRACEALTELSETIRSGGPLDIVSDDLWRAMDALSEITGENATADVIDAVFANFCVGK